jgi:SAM-dependent methyltransferase
MTQINSADSEMARYWNESGGRRWVANIEGVERMLSPLAERLLAHAAPRAGQSVLDVGCGGGLTSKAFAEAVGVSGQVIGVDVSSQILDVARQRFAAMPNLRFEEGDAGSMPLTTARFDHITSRFGVMFFPDPVGAFAHLRPALKPAGRLSFICWRELKLNPWMAVPVRAAFEILPRPEPLAPNAPGPFAFADEAYLRGILEQTGFQALEIVAHDALLNLGSLADAIQQMTRMGPAAQAFDEADEPTRAKVLHALEQAFAPSLRDGAVQLPSATWLVSARPN